MTARTTTDLGHWRKWKRTVKRRLQPLPLLFLVAVWIMLWGSLTWGNVLLGLIVAAVILLMFPLPPLALGVRLHPWPFVVLVARFLWDLVRASIQVAWASIRPGYTPAGRIVRVPLLSDNELIAVVDAQLNALVPGSVVIDLNPAERWMILHIFNAPDDTALRKALRTSRGQEIRVIKAFAANPDRVLKDEWRIVDTRHRATSVQTRGSVRHEGSNR